MCVRAHSRAHEILFDVLKKSLYYIRTNLTLSCFPKHTPDSCSLGSGIDSFMVYFPFLLTESEELQSSFTKYYRI